MLVAHENIGGTNQSPINKDVVEVDPVPKYKIGVAI